MNRSVLKGCGWLVVLVACMQVAPAQQRWTEAQANAWYAAQPWPVGANFLPSTAINELEMWQADTFDAATIDRELGWAEGIGMNTMRVFLHNLLWEQDPKGFKQRMDKFLTIAARHHIRPVFVLFDSCWDPHPKLGPQHPPDSRGAQLGLGAGAGGRRCWPTPRSIRGWRVTSRAWWARLPTTSASWPGTCGTSRTTAMMARMPRATAATRTRSFSGLLPQVFAWARALQPAQPLTSGLWHGDWSSLEDHAAAGPHPD